ncbi:MAG TPA: hypothetical protein VLA69_10155 [Gaiellaceae bacterium]|nr:hypothetical protein [Gaiellaceae bacterium]
MTKRPFLAAARVAVAASAVAAVTAGSSAGYGHRANQPDGERATSASAPVAVSRAQATRRPPLVCKLAQGAKKLPASSRRGLIDHLLQYPEVTLATPRERLRARRILARLESAAAKGNWHSVRAAERAGYDTRTRERKPGDSSVYYFHAERPQEPRGRLLLDPRRPKALIYANAPGRPLVLVGAMWSTRDGERGPNPGGPVTRWHSHTVCKQGDRRGLKPPASGTCPPGSRLTQGASEMLHVWLTGDLRSAFAIRAPQPELCAAGLLPRGFCSSLG